MVMPISCATVGRPWNYPNVIICVIILCISIGMIRYICWCEGMYAILATCTRKIERNWRSLPPDSRAILSQPLRILLIEMIWGFFFNVN